MPTSSVTAQLCDLLGEDPYQTPASTRSEPRPEPGAKPGRPTVAQAVRRCPRGAVVPARRGKEQVAVVTLDDGRRFVVPDSCPHDGQPLSDGFVEAGRLVCARHGWEFDVATGECDGRPAVCLRSAELPPRS